MSARSVKALLALARWENGAIAAAAVLVAGWWSAGSVDREVILAALAAIALTTAANAWNDLADVEIDRVAHPTRPLPRGTLSRVAARRAAWSAAALGLTLATAAAPALGALTLAVLAVAYAYSPALKRRGAIGNVAVAVVASLPFLYGAWAAGWPAAGLLLAGIAAPLHLAREIAKDVADAPADAAHRRTLALARSPSVARWTLVGAVGAFGLALTPLVVRRPAFAIAMLPTLALAAVATRLTIHGRTGGPRLFKAAMLCAMAAVLVVRP